MERQLQVIKFKEFGEMMKAWAAKPETFPRDLQAFKEAVEAKPGASPPRDAIAKVGSHVTKLTLVTHGMDELVIKLSPAEMITNSEKAITEHGGYPLAPFYAGIEAAGAQEGADHSAKMEFHAMRIADYTMGNCA
ncbi:MULTISPECIES: hypothetical protein [Roseomonadaceae]|uniref:Uncharacterized protein n=1 Tax=Falsiroseomonas oleicola TaxID=2801474 RepID=A0ABS6HEI7_9PROT|nr:hypothetical protein [Roseomonas oleicola]MBU8545695.1 hypothetical protein [Roseomonas oleicola]